MRYFNQTTDPVLFRDFDKLKSELTNKLDMFRYYLGEAVSVTSAYELTGHAKNSEHGTGEAVDIKSKAPLWWQYLCAVKAGYRNIGLYPEFNGLHLGVRIKPEETRWIGLGVDNTQEYVEFSKDNFAKYILKVVT